MQRMSVKRGIAGLGALVLMVSALATSVAGVAGGDTQHRAPDNQSGQAVLAAPVTQQVTGAPNSTDTSPTSDAPPNQTGSSESSNQNAYTQNQSNQANTQAYVPTVWNQTQSPNVYRIAGTAQITEQAPLGTIQYFTNADGHPYVVATLTQENLAYGKRERQNMSDITLPGYSTNKKVTMTFDDGTSYKGYFWNRSHLVAHMLGGEDAAKNLICGTRAQNVGKNDGYGGMQYTETLAANYLESGGDFIVYNVTPVYGAGEIIPRSVFVDVRSDDGTINQQVEVYNAAPGFVIDYKTGTWHAE